MPLSAVLPDGLGLEELLNKDIGGFSLGNLLAAALIFFICLALIRLCTRLARRALARTRLDAQLQRGLLGALRAVLWVTAALVIMGKLNISTTSLVALVSVAGLALSLSLQNTLANVFAGVTLLITRPFAVGDFIESGATSGTVTRAGNTRSSVRPRTTRRYTSRTAISPRAGLLTTPPSGCAGWT